MTEGLPIHDLSEPVVLRGAASQWPAAQWTPALLRERVGTAVVPVHTGKWKRAGWRIARQGKTTPMSAATYLTHLLEERATGYLAGFELLREVPSLRADLAFPDTGPFSVDVIWLGPAGTSTPIHYDFVPNIYAQLFGQKRWQLWRPEKPLQPRFAGLGGFAMSALDVGDGPAAAGSPDMDVVLDPGDVLLLPAQWWHRVDTCTTSIAVNRWWSLDKVGKFIQHLRSSSIFSTKFAPSGHLYANIVRIADLGTDVREAMWVLFDRIYTDVDRMRFDQDLDEKQHVILMFDQGDHSLQGFSTLREYERTIDGREVIVVYSGDTVIAPGYWGQRALHSAFVRYITLCKARHPFTPVYWFLISKGYKTYLLLSRNFPEYWPRRDMPTPEWQSTVLTSLATEKFGAAFVPERGIVRFERPMGRLREDVAPIDPEMLGDPDVRFFMEKNPGHAAGDELCCLGRVGMDLSAHYLRRRFRRRFSRSSST